MFASEPSAPQEAPGIIDATLRYRRLTIALTLAGLLLGAIYTVAQSDSYTAVGELVLTDPRGSATFRDGSSVVDFARYVNERVDFAMSGDVLEAAAKADATVGSASDLRDKCSVVSEDSDSVITISCSYSEAPEATAAVDSIVKAYRDTTRAQAEVKAKAAIDALAPEKQALEDKLAALKAEDGSGAYATAVNSATASRLKSSS